MDDASQSVALQGGHDTDGPATASADDSAFREGLGWRVLDPQGNVVDAGPVMVMNLTSQMQE